MTKETCAYFEELISARQDEMLTAAEQTQLDQHLASCSNCQATAAAFRQVDQQLRRYLQATPVPEIATPWRQELLAQPRQRRQGVGHWRIAIAGLATIVLLLVGSAALTFRNLNQPAAEQAAGSRPTVGAAAGNQVSSTTQPAQAPAIGGAAAPTAQAAARSAASAAPAAVSSDRTGAAAPAASAAASAAPAAAASSAPAAPATKPGVAPAAAAGGAATPAQAAINPVQRYRLAEATGLLICRPGLTSCTTFAQTPEEQAAVVAALDRSLNVSPSITAPAASPIQPELNLIFLFANSEQRLFTYRFETRQLMLPDGGAVQVPPDLAAFLGAIAPQP